MASPLALDERSALAPIRRFFRTPKRLALLALIVLIVPASIGAGVGLVAPVVAGAVVAAMATDLVILRAREHAWTFPDGALLTGMFIAMILSPHEPWYVAAVTSVVAVASKYVARVGKANVFNPAALALVATFYVFDTGQSWWGALPELPSIALVLLFASGILITRRVNKMGGALAFLGCYYLLFTITAFAGSPARVAALFRAPDLHAALFFAFFMVTDPPTSPPKPRDQVIYGVIAAASSFAAFELLGAAYFLLAGLLVANVWEAWRKSRRRQRVSYAGGSNQATEVES